MKRIDSTTAKVQALAPRRRQRRTTLATPPGEAGVPTLAVLAAPYGFRVYRDRCGDENIPGRFGEVFRHGPGRLAVQFGGQRANGKRIRCPQKARWRLRIPRGQRTATLQRVLEGDDEAIFHVPDALLPKVAKWIGAYRAYGTAPTSVPVAEAA